MVDFQNKIVIINFMKRFLLLLFCIIFFAPIVTSEEYTLSAGVSVNEVPKAFFGSWRVNAKLEDTNSYRTFKPQSADMWTLTRVGDTITLSNPFTGADAQISVKAVEGNLIVFSKRAPYDNKMLTDTVSIRLENGKFSGINTLTLESYSLVDNHLMKTETARYLIKGEKISGESILDK
jgi:hypothetical protein